MFLCWMTNSSPELNRESFLPDEIGVNYYLRDCEKLVLTPFCMMGEEDLTEKKSYVMSLRPLLSSWID